MKLPRASGFALLIVMGAAGIFAAPSALAIDLTRQEIMLLAQNPALAELAQSAPEVLPQAFEIIARAMELPSNDQRGVGGLDAADAQLLGDNPALLQVWYSSPEASADLLALIKTAAGGGGKPQK